MHTASPVTMERLKSSFEATAHGPAVRLSIDMRAEMDPLIGPTDMNSRLALLACSAPAIQGKVADDKHHKRVHEPSILRLSLSFF